MITLSSVAKLREALRSMAGRVALVPTMGNLHRGHMALVEHARKRADHVVVSIFVNPLQFDRQADLRAYPRTPEQDAQLLETADVDLLFLPEVETIYPRSLKEQTRVEVPGLSEMLEGASRPGHFVGVATIVCKLFNMVQPELALFGRKDYQQLLVIRRMVEDLALPIEVEGLPTVREADGLAMSSRNSYLSDIERQRAPALYRALQRTAGALLRGRKDYSLLEQEAIASVDQAGLRSDYLVIRRADDLAEPQSGDRSLVILAAAFLGSARLIDNLEVNLSER